MKLNERILSKRECAEALTGKRHVKEEQTLACGLEEHSHCGPRTAQSVGVKYHFLIAAISLVSSAIAIAETPAEALAHLEAAVRKDLESHQHDSSNADQTLQGGVDHQSVYLFRQLGPLIARQEFEQAEQVLNQAGLLNNSDDTRKAFDNLSAVLRKEREIKQNARAAQAEAILKRTAETMRSAKDPKDLDHAIADLDHFREHADDRLSGPGVAVIAKVQPTLMFVRRWQDYLAAVKNNNAKEAQSALRNAMDSQVSDIIPRSEMLERLQKYSTGTGNDRPDYLKPNVKSERIDEIVAKVKNLDGIPAAISELKNLQPPGNTSSFSDANPLGATINALFMLDRVYKEFQAGLPPQIEPNGLRLPSAASSNVVALQAQLFLLIVPRHLGVSPDLMPKPTETLDAYLVRLADEGKQRGDVTLIKRVRGAQRWLKFGYTEDMEGPGMNHYTAGQNQEAAGQYMLAVLSYQYALRIGGDTVPVKVIGERLAALKAAHPEEFEQAIRNFLNPPPPVPPFGSNFWPPQPYSQAPAATRVETEPARQIASPAPSSSAVNPASSASTMPTASTTPMK